MSKLKSIRACAKVLYEAKHPHCFLCVSLRHNEDESLNCRTHGNAASGGIPFGANLRRDRGLDID